MIYRNIDRLQSRRQSPILPVSCHSHDIDQGNDQEFGNLPEPMLFELYMKFNDPKLTSHFNARARTLQLLLEKMREGEKIPTNGAKAPGGSRGQGYLSR